MAKRKQQNLEIERQLQKRKRISQIIAMAVGVVILIAIGIGIWHLQARRWVLRYDGGRVATSDFRAIMDLHWGGVSGPGARQAALGSLEQIITVLDRAEYHGITLPQEELEANLGMAEGWRQQINQHNMGDMDIIGYIDNERLAELFFHPEFFAEQLRDIYVPNYDVDEEEFAEVFEEYLETNIYNYMNMHVHALFVATIEEADEAYSMIGTVPFEDIMRQFGNHAEDAEIEPQHFANPFAWLNENGYSVADREHVLNLEEGEVSYIIETFDEMGPIYSLIKMVSREEADLEAAEESRRERHVNERKGEIFHELVAEWTEEANFEVLSRGYNSVR